MKRQELFQLALLVCTFSEIIVNAQQKRNIKSINPVTDFRVPRSLMESLQEGVNSVYVTLQTNSISLCTLRIAENQLADLVNLYDKVANTTRNNHVSDDDKAFLQKMIERIDKLIEELEGTSTNKRSVQEQEILRSIHEHCQSLKYKIS